MVFKTTAVLWSQICDHIINCLRSQLHSSWLV